MAQPAMAELPVDLELVLAVDASGSVDEAEWRLQLDGLAAAFRDPAVLAAIQAGAHGRIAVALLVWAEGNQPKDLSPWQLVADAAAAEAWATRLETFPRRIPNGGTGIGKALAFAARQFEENGYAGVRLVIDLSGDGRETAPQDWSIGPTEGRAVAAARGVAINALAILTDEPALDAYFREEVILGPGAFVFAVQDYTSFAAAARKKLLREIEAQPNLSQR